MSLQVTNQNNVKIYSVTSGARSAIPDWLAKRKSKALKNDQEWRSRIELIQDFQFPEASLKLKYTPDRKYIMATGVYKPQIRVFDLQELSMKFERHTDCENVAFEILTDDWQKSLHLQSDRSVEVHSQYGCHYKTRIPKFGRDIKYHFPTCDAYISAASPEIYRLNLEQGRFLSPLVTASPSLTSLSLSSAHGLLACGGDDAMVEFWNPNERKKLARLDVGNWLVQNKDSVGAIEEFPYITTIEFHNDGLTCGVGTASGHVLLYDLRKPIPVLVKEHPYTLPIKHVSFHASGNVVSADAKVVRFWNKNNGKLFTSVEPPHDINDVAIPDDTGLVAIANEGVQIQTYYIPELGPAPQWCTFLDNLTEELEENPNGMTMYDDYKFLTRKELARLGLDHLVGTNLLKAYMHGFFVDLRLYQKAKAIANPFEYAEHRKKLIAAKLEKQRQSRIHLRKSVPIVNAKFAERVFQNDQSLDNGETAAQQKSKKKKPTLDSIQSDKRFLGMFEDADYEIDETSHEWRLHHPSEGLEISKNPVNTAVQDSETDSDDAHPPRSASSGPVLYHLENKREKETTMRDRLEQDKSNHLPADRISAFGAGSKSITFKPLSSSGSNLFKKGVNSESNGNRKRRGVAELRLKKQK